MDAQVKRYKIHYEQEVFLVYLVDEEGNEYDFTADEQFVSAADYNALERLVATYKDYMARSEPPPHLKG